MVTLASLGPMIGSAGSMGTARPRSRRPRHGLREDGDLVDAHRASQPLADAASRRGRTGILLGLGVLAAGRLLSHLGRVPVGRGTSWRPARTAAVVSDRTAKRSMARIYSCALSMGLRASKLSGGAARASGENDAGVGGAGRTENADEAVVDSRRSRGVRRVRKSYVAGETRGSGDAGCTRPSTRGGAARSGGLGTGLGPDAGAGGGASHRPGRQPCALARVRPRTGAADRGRGLRKYDSTTDRWRDAAVVDSAAPGHGGKATLTFRGRRRGAAGTILRARGPGKVTVALDGEAGPATLAPAGARRVAVRPGPWSPASTPTTLDSK
jgi:hypothetical protein